MVSHREVSNVNPALGLQNTVMYNSGAGVGFAARSAFKSSRTELLEQLGYQQVPHS